METSKEEKEILLWTERNQKKQASQKRQNWATAKAFAFAVLAIALTVALATYFAGLRLSGVL